MRVLLGCLVSLAVVASGCHKTGKADPNTAILETIETYLQKQPNVKMDNITVEVRSVRFEGDRAFADVNFRSKQQTDLVMGRVYILRQVGGQWQVESSTSPGGLGGPHGGPPLPQQQATAPATTPTPQASH